jgi:hypothetical protein
MALVGLSSQAAAGFSPDSFPDLRLWLDAADPTSLTLSGSNVTSWNDKSGNGRNGTPVNGLTYSAASNAVVFTRASSQYMTLPDNTFPVGSSSFSIFFVFTPTSTAFEIQLLTAGARGGNIFGIRSGNAGTGTLQTFWPGASDLQTSNLWTRNQRNLGAFLYETGGARSLWINGVQGVSEISAGPAITTNNRIGTLEPGAFNTFDGQFHEVLVFESSLSAAQRQQVEAYLVRKWEPLPSPLSAAGCVFWLDAGDRSTLTLSASNTVTAWTEKSGANRTVTTNSAGVYNATAMNGRPGVTFSSGSYMTSSTAATLGNNYTVFVVFNATSPGPVSLNVPIFVGSSASGLWLTYRGDFQVYQYRREGGSHITNSTYTTINIPVIMTGFASSSIPQQTVFLNGYSGDLVSSAAASNVGATTIYIPGGEPYWGGPANGMFNGVISEVLIFSNALTTTQRQTIEGYLSTKWGISVRVKPPVLPATHPFPRAPPAFRAFSPLDVDGLTFWVDAADSNTLTFTGSNVTQWSDKSGNGTHLVQNGTSNVPTYGASLISSKPALDFTNGSGLWTASVPKMSNVTLFVVAMMKTTTASWGTIWGHYSVNNHDYDVQLRRTADSSNINWHTNNDNSVVQLNVPPDVPVLFSCTMLNATTMTLQRVIPANTLSVSASVGATLSLGNAPIWVGRSDTNEPINGYISEILYYSGVIPAPQRQRIEEHLAAKWGFKGVMGGVAHPFRYGAPSILPTQIAGCVMWLDAADATTLTLSGSNITQWNDKSGRGYTLTVPSGKTTPTYSNGVVNLAGSNALWSTSNFEISGNSRVTLFAVFSATNANGLGGGVHIGYAALGTPPTYFAVTSFFENPTNTYVYVPTCYIPDNYTIVSNSVRGTRIMGCGIYNGARIDGTYNGTLLGGATLTTANFSAQPFQVGIRSANNTATTDGTLCEAICYNVALTTAQRQQIEGYLAWKWGLQSNLPSSTTPWLNLKRALSPLFTPNQLPGCTLWLDAADAATLTLSGSNVSTWTDKANGVVMTTQGTLSNITRTQTGINGYPSVYLNNSASNAVYLSGTLSNQLTGTAFYVFKAYSQRTVDWRPLVSWFGAATFPAYGYIGGTTVNTVGVYTAYAGNGTPTQVLTAGSNYIISYAWSGTSTAVTTNGTAPQTGSQPGYSGTSTAFQIGENGTTLEYGEVLLFNSVLSTSQRQRVEGYLAEKWGLRASLGETSHPWRYGPPMVLPTEISGCSLWLDAADATSMTLSGSNVTTWRDKSGNSRHASNGVSPTFSNSGVVFNGSSMYLVSPYTCFPSAETVFVVGTPQMSGGDNFYAMVGASVTQGRSFGIFQLSGAQTLRWDKWNVASYAASTIPNAVRSLATGVFTGSNGTTSVNGASQTAASNFSYSGTGGTNIGAGLVPLGYYAGTINEIVVYNTALTTTQREQLEGYLAWKWGISSRLPTPSHPYRTFKP